MRDAYGDALFAALDMALRARREASHSDDVRSAVMAW